MTTRGLACHHRATGAADGDVAQHVCCRAGRSDRDFQSSGIWNDQFVAATPAHVWSVTAVRHVELCFCLLAGQTRGQIDDLLDRCKRSQLVDADDAVTVGEHAANRKRLRNGGAHTIGQAQAGVGTTVIQAHNGCGVCGCVADLVRCFYRYRVESCGIIVRLQAIADAPIVACKGCPLLRLRQANASLRIQHDLQRVGINAIGIAGCAREVDLPESVGILGWFEVLAIGLTVSVGATLSMID